MFLILGVEPWAALLLSHIPCPFYFTLREDLAKFKLPRLGLYLESSCLSLPDCWHYRYAPLCLANLATLNFPPYYHWNSELEKKKRYCKVQPVLAQWKAVTHPVRGLRAPAAFCTTHCLPLTGSFLLFLLTDLCSHDRPNENSESKEMKVQWNWHLNGFISWADV